MDPHRAGKGDHAEDRECAGQQEKQGSGISGVGVCCADPKQQPQRGQQQGNGKSAAGRVRNLAEHLRALGYSVYVLRLDGHGTAPAHLTKTDWEGWLDSVRQAYAAIRHQCPRTFVGGFSLGGALAAMLAAEVGSAIDRSVPPL